MTSRTIREVVSRVLKVLSGLQFLLPFTPGKLSSYEEQSRLKHNFSFESTFDTAFNIAFNIICETTVEETQPGISDNEIKLPRICLPPSKCLAVGPAIAPRSQTAPKITLLASLIVPLWTEPTTGFVANVVKPMFRDIRALESLAVGCVVNIPNA